MKKNPTSEDISVCPFCEYARFISTDGNRLFCGKCLKEVRNNSNFKAGRFIETTYNRSYT